jgi:hypothetical protein
MTRRPGSVWIYHITDLANLPGILAAGGLQSDKAMGAIAHSEIGYSHIKVRRLTEIRIPCCANAFVGEFVPFYYCPRSPMLYTINKGNTGRPTGCQSTIVHLVSRTEVGMSLGRPWAISDGNAGAFHTTFMAAPEALDTLDWAAIETNHWSGKVHQKHSEFLVKDFFPWEGFDGIGCLNGHAEAELKKLLSGAKHVPQIAVRPDWYY